MYPPNPGTITHIGGLVVEHPTTICPETLDGQPCIRGDHPITLAHRTLEGATWYATVRTAAEHDATCPGRTAFRHDPIHGVAWCVACLAPVRVEES